MISHLAQQRENNLRRKYHALEQVLKQTRDKLLACEHRTGEPTHTRRNDMNATELENTMVKMIEDPGLQVSALGLMGPGLWHLWMIAAFSTLEKYAEPQEYEEFLERFSYLLEQRVIHGVW